MAKDKDTFIDATVDEFEPFGSRIVVRPDQPVTHMGLIELPDSAKQPRRTGIVLKIGPGRRLEDGTYEDMSKIHVGQRVAFGFYSGVDIQLKGQGGREEDFQLIQMDDVFGAVRRKAS